MIKATFSPFKIGSYNEKFSVFMNGIEPVNEIILRGECMEPKLLFNMKEVILPVVPVGFKS